MLTKEYLQTHLLRGFGTGRGTSRRYQDPRRSPHRSADTGPCCPTWACPPLPPSPSSPAAHKWGSGSPVPGLVTLTSWCPVGFTWMQRWIVAESPSGKPVVCFYFCEWVQGGRSPESHAVSSVDCLCWGPLPLLCVLGSRAGIFYGDLWHLNCSYQ